MLLCNSMDTATAWKKLRFILSERSDFHTANSLYIYIYIYIYITSKMYLYWCIYCYLYIYICECVCLRVSVSFCVSVCACICVCVNQFRSLICIFNGIFIRNICHYISSDPLDWYLYWIKFIGIEVDSTKTTEILNFKAGIKDIKMTLLLIHFTWKKLS